MEKSIIEAAFRDLEELVVRRKVLCLQLINYCELSDKDKKRAELENVKDIRLYNEEIQDSKIFLK